MELDLVIFEHIPDEFTIQLTITPLISFNFTSFSKIWLNFHQVIIYRDTIQK